MAGIANLFALIDRLKRNTAKNFQDPVGALELGLLRADEDFKANPVDSVLNSANLGGLVGMTKLVKTPKAPQADALETARRNAVEMLGLPENNTAMDRARALGFDTSAYHGTPYGDFSEFKKSEIGKNFGTDQEGFFFTNNPDVANSYAMYDELGLPLLDSSTIIPVLINKNFPFETKTKIDPITEWDVNKDYLLDAMNREGYGSVDISGKYGDKVYMIPESSNIRSRFAAFDPARRNEANLLASRLLPLALPGLLFAGDEEE